ncbi:MAG: M23 family metallopeptidase [Bacillota bacterium]|nr:M23 family metallopeptidase [Bacillota bacterium]
MAKGYYYNDYDDFGVSRSYGFERKHLGHDMMGSVGTPVIAVEGGTVEALGWNQYGGWRIGIRSHDSKRYYYYAHLRKDFPYNKSLQVGSVVQPGDVIGYLGRTGYSLKENVNNIRQSHLHIGLQLIFDESQKECNSEIWIDIYPIIQLINRNKSEVIKNVETKEYSRVYNIREIGE